MNRQADLLMHCYDTGFTVETAGEMRSLIEHAHFMEWLAEHQTEGMWALETGGKTPALRSSCLHERLKQGDMSRMTCPQCGQIDQVQSVRTVYESQTGTYSSQSTGLSSGVAYAVGVGVIPTFGTSTSYTSGTVSSRLADAVVPPPPPRLAPTDSGAAAFLLGVGAVVPFLLLLPFLWSSQRTGSVMTAFLTIAVLGALVGSLPATACIVITRRRRRHRTRARVEFEAYSALYQPLLAVWSAALLCHRCHVGFVPYGSVGPSAEAGGAVPLPHFQGMLQRLAQKLLM